MVAAVDSSGNGRDATYVPRPGIPSPISAVGLVPEDAALRVGEPTGTFLCSVDALAGGVNASGDFSIAFWVESGASYVAGTTGVAWAYQNSASSGSALLGVNYATGEITFGNPGIGAQTWRSGTGVIAADGLPHFVVTTFDAFVTGQPILYVAGSSVSWAVTGSTLDNNPVLDTFEIGPNFGGVQLEIIDEFATFQSVLSSGDVSGLYSAGTIDFATWNTAVLALSPYALYHLDEGVATGWYVDTIGMAE